MWKVVRTWETVATSGITQESFGDFEARFSKKQCQNDEEIIAFAHDADAIITTGGSQSFSRQLMSKLESCRVITTVSIGYEKLDVAGATELGICIANVVASLDEVSDHALALLLACSRQLFLADRLVREGKMRGETRFTLTESLHRLSGQRLGLVGLGRIAQTLVPKAKALGLHIMAFDPFVSKELADKLGVELVDLDYLLAESNFVSVHTPLTEQTRHMLGEEQLRKMKPTAYLINTARGAVIDPEALYTALTHGYIAGAALDVLDPEPPDPADPLLKLDNVIVTGHLAGASAEANAGLRQGAVEAVIRVLTGSWPRYLVNPGVKERFEAKWGKMAD